jgi:hypothetical protein
LRAEFTPAEQFMTFNAKPPATETYAAFLFSLD